jgi:hypothetical protein
LSFKKTVLLIFIISFSVSCSKKYIKRATLSREIAFSKMFVFPLTESDSGTNEFSELVQEAIIKKARLRRSLKVISFRRSRGILGRLNADPLDFAKKATLQRLAEITGADTALLSEMNSGAMTLSLYSTFSGEKFYEVTEKTSSGFNEYSSKSMSLLALRRLLGLIPYDALVSKVKGKFIEINAGSRSGVQTGATMTVFDVLSMSGTADFPDHQRVPIALIKIMQTGKTVARGKIVRHNKIFAVKKYAKVSFLNFFRKISKEDLEE